MKEHITLGIDFGTSTTGLALRRPGQPPVILPIGDDGITTYMPSVVAFRPAPGGEAQTLVGEEAERVAGIATVVRSVKRCLGCRGDSCGTDRRGSVSRCDGTGMVAVPGVRSFQPAEIVFLIVEEAVNRGVRVAREMLGLDLLVREVVLSPANFGCSSSFPLEPRQILRDVAHKVGFKGVDLSNVIDEPIAAGVGYARLAGVASGRVLIYDFGGGTFDTAVLDVDVDSSRITILAADGVRWLGGDDIDQMIYDFFLAKIAKDRGLPIDQVEEQLGHELQALRRQCTEGKEYLSQYTTFEGVLLSERLGMILLDLDRDQLHQMMLEKRFDKRDFVEQSLACVLSTYRAALAFDLARSENLLDPDKIHGINLEDMKDGVGRVILVGGVTKMPHVRQRILDLFGADRVVSEQVVEPVDAVAIGAAYPKEMEHFSLLHPPYSIELVLPRPSQPQDKIITLHRAYDRLGHFSGWPSNTSTMHIGSKHALDHCYSHALLRFVGDGIQAPSVPIKMSVMGSCHITIDMAGRIKLHNVPSGGVTCRVPLIHPVQDEIIRSEKERQRVEKAKQDAAAAVAKSTIFTEN